MWEDIFEKQILYRGETYFKDGFVEDLAYDESYISSSIHGTYLYTIRIDLHHNQILNMSCDCPHAHQKNKCKHMVATLLAYEDQAKQKLVLVKKDDLGSIIESTDLSILKSFLLKNLRSDEELLEEFLRFRVNPNDRINDLQKGLDEIFFDYITGRFKDDMVFGLHEFLDLEAYHSVKYRDYKSLKFMLTYILKKIVILDIKEDEFDKDILDLFITFHQALFSHSREEEQMMLLSEISDTLYNTKNEYSRVLVDRMLYYVYQEVYPEAVDKYFVRQIEPLESKDTSLRPLNHSGLYRSFRNYINHCVLIDDQKREEKLFQEYLFYEEIHHLYVAKMHHENNISAMILLLEAAKEKGSFDYAFHCSSILKEEYYNQGNREKYLDELVYLASKDYSAKTFKEARIVFSQDEWDAVRYGIYKETEHRPLRYTMYGLDGEVNLLWML